MSVKRQPTAKKGKHWPRFQNQEDTMPQPFWKIQGYDGLEKTFEQTIPFGSLSEKEMIALLQRLAARHLDDEEVVSASLRKNACGYEAHLEVNRIDSGLMTTGSGHNYTATVVNI